MTTQVAPVTGTQVAPVVGEDRAHDLMRLGWAIAELRGRVYFRQTDPGCIAGNGVVRFQHSLPLYTERSSRELFIETQQVVQELAQRTRLDLDGSKMKDSGGVTPPAPCTAAARVTELASQVPEKRSAASWGASWNAFTLALYQWDAAIQDRLAGASFGESSAYQLGRGLAECSWALDPECPANDVMGWEHVLGSARCVALTRLLDRLVPVVSADAASAIKGSLAAWQRVARDPAWRGDPVPEATGLLRLKDAAPVASLLRHKDTAPEAPVFLRRQVDIWRDMLVGGTDPRVFARPPALVQNVANIIPIIRGLWVQLLSGLVSIVALGAGLWYISKYGNSKALGAVVSALGIFGITASSLLVNAKKKATGLVDRVQKAIAADEIAQAATIIPAKPKGAGVKSPGRLSTPGSFAEPITLPKLHETPLHPDPAT
jgi:hypothetical protein